MKQSCTSKQLMVGVILHYQGTANTLEDPRERPGKPYDPTAHENDVANSTCYQHRCEPKNQEIHNGLKKLQHELTDRLVTARLGPGACGLVVRYHGVDAFEHTPAVTGHVQGVTGHKSGVRTVDTYPESFVHLGDGNNKNIEKK